MILKLVLDTLHIKIELAYHPFKHKVELTYNSQRDTTVFRDYAWDTRQRNTLLRAVHLSLTCRHLYFTIKHLFYSSNIFSLRSAPAFRCWELGLGVAWSNTIRRLALKESLAEWLTVEELSTRWKSLQLVYLVFPMFENPPPNSPRNAAEKFWLETGVKIVYLKPKLRD